MEPQFTEHSSQRASQRSLSEQEIDYVQDYGQIFHKAGALIYFLRSKDIPTWDQGDDRWTRLAGTALILSKDGCTLITAWRNRRTGLKRIKRKPDYSFTYFSNHATVLNQASLAASAL